MQAILLYSTNFYIYIMITPSDLDALCEWACTP